MSQTKNVATAIKRPHCIFYYIVTDNEERIPCVLLGNPGKANILFSKVGDGSLSVKNLGSLYFDAVFLEN